MRWIYAILFCFNLIVLKAQSVDAIGEIKVIDINWVVNLNGDFTFVEKWEYPLGVYKNDFGQLSCDGICPDIIHRMKDENGKIYQDSLDVFYQAVDTTHQHYSLKSDAWTYEWLEANFMNFTTISDSSILGQSECNIATHSSLFLNISGDSCRAWIDFNSITDIGRYIFPLEYGTISIDKTLFKEGIVKVKFDLKFKNTIEPEKQIYWKGLIYSKVKNK